LLYHRIAAEPGDPYAVSPAAFAIHLRQILASGRRPLTITQLAATLARPGGDPRGCVAITFDDGFAETAEAVRSLTTLGLKATVYVTTGSMGAPGMLTAEQVVALARRDDVEVGAHTVTHPYLDECNHAEMNAEIVDSRDALRALGICVRSFAYPHGAYGASVRQAVIGAGFSSAVAVKNALSHERDDPWAIARCTVLQTTSPDHVARLLDGRGAPLAWEHERRRTRAYRLARRVSRRLGTSARVRG